MTSPRYRVKPRLQAYLDEHPLKRVGGGSQATVYGNDKLVVKAFRPMSVVALRAQEKGILGHYERYKLGKEKLGGLALPFEIAEEVNLLVVNAMGG